MKNNLISGIASWKSAALLAIVAMVATVAFSGVLSTPQTAEAAVQMRNTDGTFAPLTGGTTTNGTTVYIQHDSTGGYVQFEITSLGASGSFTHSSATNNGQTIVCNAATTAGKCDVDTGDTGVTVALKVDADSAAGVIFVKQTRLTGSGGDAEVTESITVTVAPTPTKLTITPASTSINSGAGAATAESTTIDIRLTDENAKGIPGSTLTIVSSRALLSPVESGVNDTITIGGTGGDDLTFTAFSGDGVLAGTVNTSADPDGTTPDTIDSAGYARVVLTGGGSAGVSTVTVTVGDISASVDIVLHGPIAAIAASAEQSAIEVGGSTFIVVTATDAAGNPVKGQEVSTLAQGGVVPPERLANPVQVLDEVNKYVGPANAGALVAAIGELPACGAHTGAPDEAITADVDESRPGSTGTNDAGKCVLQVSAVGGDTPSPADDAARGTHTITLVASATGAPVPGVDAAVVEIEVGGAPSSIETDAPSQIAPSDEVTVNITVLDDEDVRVGGVAIEVLHTAGDGAIIADAKDKTVDGRASFTYIAPSTPGVVEFLVRTKNALDGVTAQQPIIIQIGEAAPTGPAPTWSETPTSGTHNLVWNGADGPASDGAVEGLVAIWRWENGGWLGYVPGLADNLNELENGKAYWVVVE
ncbi:MAG: hypothetical protein F4Y92_04145 [Dehalococcoidia bacterium]|nr:hypothetical protein [Dehalococcoidia bacterium]